MQSINKRVSIFLLLCSFSFAGIAQQTLPAQYSNPLVNYVRTWDAVKPVTNPNDLSLSASVTTAKMTTQYLDGLGRPIQAVIKQGSLITDPSNPTSAANAVDITSGVVYDEFGRQRYTYLPSPANNTGTNTHITDGLFKNNPFQQQEAFYNNYLSGQISEVASSKNWAYGQTNFEASPLNRVMESFSPGVSWVGTSGDATEANRKSIKAKYYINTATDAVRIWTVTNGSTGSFGTYATAGTYAAGELYKNISVDEKNKQVIEFKDKEGKVILKKIQLTATSDDGTGKDHTNWLCTYYIYDDLNNLRAVIQPEGVKTLAAASWSLTTTLLNEQSFRYEYDGRNRMIMKKVPGAGEVYMVYDIRDRLVMVQDANLRALTPTAKWLVTVYDELNRPKETGLLTNGTSFTSHMTAAAATAPGTNYPSTTSNYEQLTVTHYDDYLSIPGSLTNTFDNSWSTYFNGTYNTSPLYAQQQTASIEVKGMVTWTQTKILGSSPAQFVTSVMVYDDKGRVIQTKTLNSTNGTDVVTTQYSWIGQPLVTVQKQEKAGSPAQTIVLVTQMSYDELGRLVKTEKKQSHTSVNSNAMSAYKTIAQNEYDALGQLKKKKLAPAYNSNAGLETLTYDYNIRGWLLGANRDYAKDGNNNNYFGFDLGYDKTNNGLVNNQTYTAAQYNGNIAGMVWKSKGDGEKRKYDFDYDAANRLLKADFTQYTGTTFNTTAGINYNIKMGDGTDVNTAYDYNGNIKQMQQWGLKGLSSIQIDNLAYTYESGSSKLSKVIDAVTADNKLGDFKDGSNGSGTDYSYDVNGNLILDNNKAISSITYNHLNLPSVITVTGKGTISYTYDVAGNKIKKVTQENSATVTYNGSNYTSNITTTTLYLGGAVYESKAYSHASLSSLNYTDKLQFICMEEGRIRFREADNTLQYDYMLKDHLGNVRMLLTEEQKQDQYPAATLETATINTEQTYYSNLSSTQYNKPAWFSDPNYGTNAKVARVMNDASSQKVGPSIVLKVMAGDTYNIRVASGWSSGTATNSSTNVLSDLLSKLSTGVAGISGGKTTASDLQAGGSGLNTALTTFMSTQTTSGSKPKAYVNWILLDEQFKIVTGSSGFEQVGASGAATIHAKTNLTVTKSGYLYVYVSNEATNIEVFFDNLQVTHNRGAILEETHYYPFGLAMTGISNKALAFGNPQNRYKFNGGTELANGEFNDGSGLEIYETQYRGYDAQIGRFHQIDALSDLNLNWSTYTFAQNNPILFNDPYGLDTIRGKLPKGYVPQSGDVWINNKGKQAIYNAEGGWIQSQDLENVTVRANKWAAIVFLFGLGDTYYGLWESSYDHRNYTTTKGKLKPFPVDIRRMSGQANKYKLRSKIVKGTGIGISLLSNLLTAIEVRDQHLKGGMSNINPVDFAGLTIGTAGLAANIFQAIGFKGSILTGISTFSGRASMGLGAFQNMYMALQIVYNTDLPNNPRYSGTPEQQFQAAMDEQNQIGERWY